MIEINGKKMCSCCFAKINSEPCQLCGFNGNKKGNFPVLPIGSRLNNGRIVIGGVLGHGGFGITYSAYDILRDELIAVKEYYPNHSAYRSIGQTNVFVSNESNAEIFETGAEKFFSEAETVRQFNGNPNIVSVYEVFRENNTVYISMEYLKGLTVQEYVKQNGSLDPGQAVIVAIAAAQALQIIHSRDVVHKDISPDNIMLCLCKENEKQGKIKILDFGAARETNQSQSMIIAKTGYTPVEQLAGGGKPSGSADIYALGAVMFFMLTGEAPLSSQERLDSENNKKYMSSNHGIDPKLWKIIKKATMLKPEDRYQSADEMLSAFKKLKYYSDPIIITDDNIRKGTIAFNHKDNNIGITTFQNSDMHNSTDSIRFNRADETRILIDNELSPTNVLNRNIDSIRLSESGATEILIEEKYSDNELNFESDSKDKNFVSISEQSESKKQLISGTNNKKRIIVSIVMLIILVLFVTIIGFSMRGGSAHIINDFSNRSQPYSWEFNNVAGKEIEQYAQSIFSDVTELDLVIWLDANDSYISGRFPEIRIRNKLEEKYNRLSKNAGIAVAIPYGEDINTGHLEIRCYIITMNGSDQVYNEKSIDEITNNFYENLDNGGLYPSVMSLIDDLAKAVK